MAEGLVHRSEGKNLWKTGLDYFKELVSRSFFQESSSNSLRFSMHDLLNDLAKSVAGPTHFSLSGSNESNASSARHASFISSYGIASERLKVYRSMKRLRSFISLQPRPKKFAMLHLSQSVLGDLLSDLKYLKVFSLSHYCISEVPDCVGKLRHLHYLNLSYAEIESLPESIGELLNLEALILRGCPYLAGLPQGVENLINLRFLDIRETQSLQAMPRRIGNLVNLEILSKFIVGTENGRRLKELKRLEHLRGELLISELHKVKDAGDARDANLHMKRGIDRLIMKWSKQVKDAGDAKDAIERMKNGIDQLITKWSKQAIYATDAKDAVLCMKREIDRLITGDAKDANLRMKRGIDQLIMKWSKQIEDTGDAKDANLCMKREIGRSIMKLSKQVKDAGDARDAILRMKSGIVELIKKWSERLEDLRKAELELETEVLEFLQPHKDLRDLTISYYSGIEFPFWLGDPLHLNIVSLRLCGCRNVGSLPSLGLLTSLKELHIEGLNAVCTVGSEFYETTEPFPSLTTLEFKDMSFWQDWTHFGGTEEIEVPFPCLQHLMVHNCPMLKGRLPGKLDALVRLEIDSCPLLHASPAVSLLSLRELYFRSCNEVTFKSLVNMTSLTTLAVENVEGLTRFPRGYTRALTKLEKFEVRRCKNLIHLWQDRDYVQNLACLKSLDVISCRQFVSFIARESDRELPSRLEAMKLSDCSSLEKLPDKVHNLASLRSLIVLNCPKLRSFPETGLPASMTSLTVENCQNLQHLPIGTKIGNETSRLRELRIYRCDSLPESPFGKGGLPETLKELKIHNCREVKSLAEIVADSGHQHHVQWLEDVRIFYCEQLGSLPRSLHKLSHLTRLTIFGCPALELEHFPPLPASISEFSLWSCPNVKSLPDKLHHLTSLRSLYIVDCKNIKRFPRGGLPPNIETFEVRVCVNMEQHMEEWGLHTLALLQSLWIDGSVGGLGDMVCFPPDSDGNDHDLLPSSLTYLNLSDMRSLESLSSGLPCSLQRLYTRGCRKLRCLPKAGLPSSLEHLSISDCKLLEEQCLKHAGNYWHLIKEIPTIYINNDLIS
ncbi:putative disease resistance protein At3g14460 [Eucalyptus grandis]|uniref:putative disease resistance protein At3g14460 n=1 Tax=Eucalyptus grandis TaxID=71139 RepID=UPI00192E8970|nr:putative disease resistance protein At3g14460 [Eucalyptus grandis]